MMVREKLHKKLIIIAFAILFSATVLFSGFTTPVNAAGNTTVKVDPSTQTIAAGTTFTISIPCVPNQAIKAFELQIAYNPSLLKANSVSKGTIFRSYSTFFNDGTIDNTKGTITSIYDIILGTGSTSSSGTLVTISFTAKTTTGTSAISLKNVGILNSAGYIPKTLTNGSVQITQAQQTNNPVVYDDMTPINKSTNIPITTKSISISMRDPEGKSFDYTIQTSPNIGRVSVTNAANGTKTCTLSGLKYATTYKWYVNATDGVNWKRRWYVFTTALDSTSNIFTFSSVTPGDGTTGIPITTSKISITVQNTQGHNFDMTIKTSPNIGSSTRSNAVNGVKSLTITGLSYSTTYRWYVSCKDVTNGQWANQSYWFKTESDPNGGGSSSGGGGGGGSTSGDDDLSTPSEDITYEGNPLKPEGPTYIEPGVNYYYTSSVVGLENTSARLRFFWGDGTYSEWTDLVPTNMNISLSHTWANLSSYNITVIAQDEYGINSSLSEALTVLVSSAGSEIVPSAVNITTSPSNISTNQIIEFIPINNTIASEKINSYYWEFGDGKTATNKKPKNIYTTPGQYIVNLTITDTAGNVYTEKIIVTVEAAALVTAQNKADFLPFILITSSTIGLVITIIIFFFLFSKELLHLPLKKYIIFIFNLVKRFAKNLIAELRSILLRPKPTKKISDIHETEKIASHVEYTTPKEYSASSVEDLELAYIHKKIDQLIMDL
jgi:hypothetical protein